MNSGLLILIRWGAALFATLTGWIFGFASFLILEFSVSRAPGPLAPGLRGYGIASGLFCLGAWVVVGLPLAVWNPDLSSGKRPLTATLLCGVIGCTMVVLFFRSFSFISIFLLLAFITATISMLTYISLIRRLK